MYQGRYLDIDRLTVQYTGICTLYKTTANYFLNMIWLFYYLLQFKQLRNDTDCYQQFL